jgi:hypothetical protein
LNGGGANANNPAISQNLATIRACSGTASGSNIGANSALKPQLDQIATDVTNQTQRLMGGGRARRLAGQRASSGARHCRGSGAGDCAQYNTDVANQLGAAGSLYGAGNSTYGMLNANQAHANTNFTNGVGQISAGLNAQNAAPTAAINAAAQQFGIPVSQLQTLLGSISPVAAQFGTQNANSTGENQMSGAQQFAMIAQGLGSLWPKAPISFGAS